MKDHFAYILRCATGDLYTGYTVDPKRRLDLHNLGKASKFTRSRLPVKLVYIERFLTKSEALRREIEIKRFSRKEKLHLIRSRRLLSSIES
ncbi:MAG: GIY-YIG nuclease family protein [Nitrososphaerales archaeon]